VLPGGTFVSIVGMLFTKATHCEKSFEYAGAEDDYVVRVRIAHGLQERGYVSDVVSVAHGRVAGEAGFDVTYIHRRSVQDSETPQRQPDGGELGLRRAEHHPSSPRRASP